MVILPRKSNARTPLRKEELRKIHDLAREAGYETRPGKPGRAEYEARLMELIGRTSTRQAPRSERAAVIEAFSREASRKRLPEYTPEELDKIINAESIDDLF